MKRAVASTQLPGWFACSSPCHECCALVQEYRRAAQVLSGLPGPKALFLRCWCLYLAGEKRRECVPAARPTADFTSVLCASPQSSSANAPRHAGKRARRCWAVRSPPAAPPAPATPPAAAPAAPKAQPTAQAATAPAAQASCSSPTQRREARAGTAPARPTRCVRPPTPPAAPRPALRPPRKPALPARSSNRCPRDPQARRGSDSDHFSSERGEVHQPRRGRAVVRRCCVGAGDRRSWRLWSWSCGRRLRRAKPTPSWPTSWGWCCWTGAHWPRVRRPPSLARSCRAALGPPGWGAEARSVVSSAAVGRGASAFAAAQAGAPGTVFAGHLPPLRAAPWCAGARSSRLRRRCCCRCGATPPTGRPGW